MRTNFPNTTFIESEVVVEDGVAVMRYIVRTFSGVVGYIDADTFERLYEGRVVHLTHNPHPYGTTELYYVKED